ncbi:DUF3606 domain-containing protein [Cupriavidus sp. HPC(L)]|uniref:DUF3606 domain-containing protein n=1 Tax=Cupriavidus sp. HPC(L) TaxID=1217418 RepID=UPI0002915B8A|nr:DUF3606 domain-containing protein [Cupriavidus sp. HPC(L)]
MSDDLQKRGPADRSRINVNEQWELHYWSARFGVTPQALKNAVAKVGVMVTDVQKYLGK